MEHVVGLDVSLTGTGMAAYGDDGWRTQVIKTVGKKTDTLMMRKTRLAKIHKTIMGFVPADALVVIEQPAYSMAGGSSHDRSGLWWRVVEDLTNNGHKVVELVPQKGKRLFTGSGTASKMQMVAAAIKRYPDADVIDDNAADAIALASLGGLHLGVLEMEFPKLNLEAMNGIIW